MLILSFFLSFLFRCQCKDGRAFFFVTLMNGSLHQPHTSPEEKVNEHLYNLFSNRLSLSVCACLSFYLDISLSLCVCACVSALARKLLQRRNFS